MTPQPGQSLEQSAQRIGDQFEAAFGATPLNERINDILSQATSLGRFADISNLRDEAGDLICSVLQLCNECGWRPEDLIEATLAKINSRSEIYRRLGRRLRVALYRGTFDPVHLGQIDVAKHILRSGHVDEVWLMPCYEGATGSTMASAEQRLEMCRLAIADVPGMSVFDYEVLHRFRGETYHLVKRLLSEDLARERCDFSLIVGQEHAETFVSWTNYDGLERLIDFIVVPKAGMAAPRPSAWYLKPPHRFLDEFAPGPSASETEVQRLLQQGDPQVTKHLPPKLAAYIRAERLYDSASSQRAPMRHKKIAIFHQHFDPPSRFHRQQAENLLKHGFDEILICPRVSGLSAGEREHALPMHRAALLSLAFQDMADVTIDYDDISLNFPSSAASLEARHAELGELWHVVDAATIAGGANGTSAIQTQWTDGLRLWKESRFVVTYRENNPPRPDDLPPQHRLLASATHPTSAELRSILYQGGSVEGSLTEMVARYVIRHRLFLPNSFQRHTQFRLDKPRLRIVANTKNERSMALARQFMRYESDSPDLILVLGGDGTMLHAIREHWRSRIPFLGLNTGNLGFLMNERLPQALDGLELVSYSLPMLRVDALAEDESNSWGLAFSDVWLERAEGQSAWMQLDVDGETRARKVVGDGMLIATAAGSSAYARAMGAAPVPLNTSTLALVGSNIFQPRFWKPMVISDESLVRLANLDDSRKRPLRGFIDGIAMGIVKEISVRRSLTASVEMAFTREFDPSSRLLRSLFPDSET